MCADNPESAPKRHQEIPDSQGPAEDVGQLRGDIKDLRGEVSELRERMAHLEGLLEGLREAITGRAAAREQA